MTAVEDHVSVAGWGRRLGSRVRCDDGSAALEAALLAPALLALLAFAVVAMRIEVAAGAVEAAAYDAARAASIARSSATAHADATTAAAGTLARQGLQCQTLSVDVDTAEFARPVGQPANVTARIACTVRLADVAAPGMPGARTVTATFTSPIDPYRARTADAR